VLRRYSGTDDFIYARYVSALPDGPQSAADVDMCSQAAAPEDVVTAIAHAGQVAARAAAQAATAAEPTARETTAVAARAAADDPAPRRASAVLHMMRNMTRTEEMVCEDQVTCCPRTATEGSASMAASMSAVNGAFRAGRSAAVQSSAT
jgi:hypothetical protein